MSVRRAMTASRPASKHPNNNNLTRTFAVGVVLDKARGRTGPRYTRRYLLADPVHAACQIASIPPACLVSEGGGRVHVSLHDFRVHGSDGILLGAYRLLKRRCMQAINFFGINAISIDPFR